MYKISNVTKKDLPEILNILKRSNLDFKRNISDLEKACEGLALLDLTNFLIAPQFKNINKPEAMEAYKEIRSFQDKGRQFFEVHNAICQVGSFHHQKSPKVRYFLELAREKLKDMGENRLRNSLNFVEPYFL